MKNYNLEIIGVGSLQPQDRTTLRIPIDYLVDGIEFSTTLYVSRQKYNDVELTGESSLLREFLHNELVKQKEMLTSQTEELSYSEMDRFNQTNREGLIKLILKLEKENKQKEMVTA